MPSLSTTQLVAAALSAVGLMVLLPGSAMSDPPPDSDPGSAILLHNGRVLEGSIRREGDRYHVFLPAGRITIPASKVAYVGDSLTDIYHYKRARVWTDPATTLLELVQWCLRNDLIEEAHRELKRLEAQDPKHPHIAMLNEQIAFRQKQPADAEAHNPERDAARQRWDQMVRRWSPGGLHQFATRIQPLLIRHCATAGCHGGPSAGRFQLNRNPGRGVDRRAATLDNLDAVLPLIDGEDPSASPLLTYPIRPHANQPSAVFSHRDGQPYAELVEWTRRVASFGSNRDDRDPPAAGHATVESGTGPRRKTSPEQADATREPVTRR